ncbi:S-adenosylmethionine:tRNA ribosyltransferase-isomerase [Dysgonomonas mossii]|uniref:S-adenosylmethionine:tRNA ribosyltransferase-isomerase n=1 Tax=Dysgonomonas mossii TaxID=163665 RepID=A0A4Y9ILG8_9BACT|nr:S-adenosylmethionine:tRNA ribosyltransferase-isomerase [Dysgonomonas mossii]MBF0761534.1 S-adenosylmethionine:tRNA ribosyltransferase-isomerase [Dysgonomonas mossii]TFU89172.1 S-adenosylmethionine:tRNA ribosyltransferase-isomerase [Dysgonomonas mossii]
MEISSPQKIHIQDYNYNLPDNRIAKYPLTKRDNSKLLVYKNEKITDTVFSNINNFLPENCLMVFNNTKVIQARLHFQKTTGAQIEIFCLEPCIPNDYQLNFQQTEKCSWVCLIGNLKKWKEGSLTRQINVNEQIVNFTATRTKSHGDAHVIDFEWDNQGVTFSELLDAVGELPIPPYLNRATEEQDKQTYQTVYSKIDGSVAAPTAGLHFTSEVMKSLKDQGMKLAEVTLHVGAGTFRPVKSDEIGDHVMHSEFISVQKSFIEELIRFEGKVIAVGTTSVRTLESLYYIGVSLESQKQSHLHVSQWMPYSDSNNRLSKKDALKNILAYLEANSLSTLIADTQIIIAPGYEFKIVDGIVTNFHQPQSTLLLLVSAFLGNNNWKNIYEHALSSDYRFLSYGDSSLLLKD